MGKKTISLEIRENNKIIRIAQVALGLVCMAIAIFWLIYNIKTVSTGSLWITLLFLCGFGAFQIYSGLGYADKYIEIESNKIKLRLNSLTPSVELVASDIGAAEVYPLKVVIILKSAKRILIRLGVTNSERIELVKDEMIRFVTANNIPLEIKNE